MGERKDLPVGTRLGDGDRYEVRRRIGQGAMAEVYQAVDRRLNNRIVAVKMLSASVTDHQFGEKMLALFIDEARALSRVKDDNVVDVLDSGTTADGVPYMVMEFLNGRDLSIVLKQEKQLSVERTADTMLAVCAGVHACHLAGIIHRDLKPANIFLEQTAKGEQPKVLDFSVAKAPVSRDQTRTDLIVGTANYMSPEQALGRPADELSDQYSIGALIFRCLVGKPPHGLLAHAREIRPEIPEELEAVLLRAMDPIPPNRYPSVHHLGHDLLAFASPSGRLRWDLYYATSPLAVPVTFDRPAGASGPIDVDRDATTKAKPYDFGLHDRTTQTVAPVPGHETATPDHPVTGPADDGPPTLNAKPTFDPGQPPPSTDNLPNGEVAGRDLPAGSIVVSPSPALPAVLVKRRRQRVVATSAVGGLTVLIGVFVAFHILGTRHLEPSVPVPPAWTHAEQPKSVEHPPVGAGSPTIVRAVPLSPTPAFPSEATPALPPADHARENPGKEPEASVPTAVTSNARRVGNPRRRTHSQRDRSGLPVGSLRWLGGAVNDRAVTNQDVKARYPAVGPASDSKYPAVQ
jgi:serine/threonine protein kinase